MLQMLDNPSIFQGSNHGQSVNQEDLDSDIQPGQWDAGVVEMAIELYQLYPWNLPFRNWQDSGYSLQEFALLVLSTVHIHNYLVWRNDKRIGDSTICWRCAYTDRDCTHSTKSKLTPGVIGWTCWVRFMGKTCCAPGSFLSPGGECCITEADDDAGDQGAPFGPSGSAVKIGEHLVTSPISSPWKMTLISTWLPSGKHTENYGKHHF